MGRPRGVHRTRWAAAGAALAVTIGSGGLMTTSASIGSGDRAVFVPITPCRLLDTRPGSDNVGARNGPLGSGETFTTSVRGANGNCTIPDDATAVAMNVAVVDGTAASFLTLWPSDASRPLTANLNWVAGAPPTPNKVDVRIGADGRISMFNLTGNVHVVADVFGYYADHHHDDRYYTRSALEHGSSDIGILERMSDRELALERWGLDPGRNAAIPVTSHLGGTAFDGDFVWVGQTGVGAGHVLKIDPRTNQVVQTITGPAVPNPNELLFDGTAIWAFSGGVAGRIDAASGAVTGPITIGDGTRAVTGAAFDGTSIWVSLAGLTGTALRLSPTTGAVQMSVATGSNPNDIAFDGTHLWTANTNANSLSKIVPSTGSVTTTASSLASSPYDLAFDGQYLWVKEFASLRRIDPVNNSYVGGAIAAEPGPSGLWYDGRSIWLVNNLGLQRLDRLTNAIMTIDAVGSTGGTFDGTNVWYLARTPARVMKITP